MLSVGEMLLVGAEKRSDSPVKANRSCNSTGVVFSQENLLPFVLKAIQWNATVRCH